MKLAALSIVTCTSLLVLAPNSAAQNQRWVRQIGTGAPDFSGAAATDGQGGLYAGGSTGGSLGGPSAGTNDAWLARYGPSGEQLWIRQFGTSGQDDCRAAAPDDAGGVYAGGRTRGSLFRPYVQGDDVWIARYDATGAVLWGRQIGTFGSEAADALAADGAGGVFVCGETSGSLGGPIGFNGVDVWVARYDGSGDQLWIRQFGESAFDSVGFASPDGSGGVYVGGRTQSDLAGPNAGSWDAWIARYDAAGTQLWIRQFGTSSAEFVGGAAPDGAGGVFIGGGSSGAASQLWVARYDENGNELWFEGFGAGVFADCRGVSADASGGVYLTGSTQGDLGGPNAGGQDLWLARYDGAGSQRWLRQLGTSGQEATAGAAPDGSGGVYLTGDAGGLGGPGAGLADAFVARHDGDFDATRYCVPPVANSLREWSMMTVLGSNLVADDRLTLAATQLPPGVTTFFLASRTAGFTPQPGGSLGNLCLDGAIGRYVGAGQVLNSGADGAVELALDLTRMPTPTGLVPAQPGETWHFQAWHRDSSGGVATSNFTDAVAVPLN